MPMRRITDWERTLPTLVNADHLGQPVVGEPAGQGAPRRFGRVTVPPARPGQPPADLDGRGERCVETRDRQSGETDELSGRDHFHGPQAESAVGEARLDRSISASLCSRVSRAGKYSITSGSAFIAANGTRSAGCQRRSSSRPVRSPP